jgi:hypothetical protein
MRRLSLVIALLLAALSSSRAADEPKRLLLVGQGPDGHPKETHEFMAGLRVLDKCLSQAEGPRTTTVKADEPWRDGPKQLAEADGVVLFLTQGARWMQNDARRYEALTRLAARGGGIVALHWAVGAQEGKYVAGQLRLLGASRGGPNRKHTVADFDVSLPNPKHPIVAGVSPERVNDEFYYRLDVVDAKPGIVPLLSAKIEGRDETVAWAWERPDGGRSFGFVGLHFHRNWRLEYYRRLVTQGVLWSLKLPIPEKGVDVGLADENFSLPK